MLDIEQAIRYIRLLNGDVTLMASDFVLSQCFPIGEFHFDHRSKSNQVILVDKLWNAGLRYAPDAATTIAEQLVIHAQDIHANLANLQLDDLRNDPNNIYEAVEQVFPIVLETTDRQNYVFTTKFFHWCTRIHFPIVDVNARDAVSRLQREEGDWAEDQIVQNIDDNPNLSTVEKYRGWIDYYNRLLNQLSQNDCERLLKVDKESQRETCPSLTITNSLLRILDKVFYMNRGKDTLSTNLENSRGTTIG